MPNFNRDQEMDLLAAKSLKGKTISKARYMTESEAKQFMWYNRPVVIEFTDGTIMIPQSDDEGNDGGVLWMLDKKGGAHNEILLGTL